MKKLLFGAILSALTLFTSCDVQQQAQKMMALQKCKYHFTSLSNFSIAGVNAQSLVGSHGLNIASAPQVALALLRKDVPLQTTVNVQIENPTANIAGINEFDYSLLLQNHELTSGTIAQEVQVPANGGISNVPIKINLNVFNLLTDSESKKDIANFFSSLSKPESDGKSLITIKLRPTFSIAGSKIKYPGFITVSKDVSKKILL